MLIMRVPSIMILEKMGLMTQTMTLLQVRFTPPKRSVVEM